MPNATIVARRSAASWFCAIARRAQTTGSWPRANAARMPPNKHSHCGVPQLRDAAWSLLFLAGVVHAQVPLNPFDYARTKSFTYNADGTLATTTVEPANAASCSVTAYQYSDGHGNITSTTTANCNGASGRAVFASRTNSVAYAGVAAQGITTYGSMTPNVSVAIPAGLLPSSAQNALLQTETRQYDPRFGALIQQVSPNGLATNVVVDDFGRKVKELNPDGTSVLTYYCVLSTTSLDQSANSVGCPTPAAGEAPSYAVRFVHTEPRDTASTKMGPFARVYLDKLGRQIRKSTESFDGANQPAGRSGAIVVSDTVYDANGAKVIETQPYFLSAGSSTTQGSNDLGAVKFVYDELGRQTATYAIDANANSANTQSFGGSGAVGYGVYGVKIVSTTTYAYVGLNTTTTNDKGQTRTEEKSANGDILRVTDTTGAQIAYQLDAFGNVIKTIDALQNSITATFDYKGLKTLMSDPDKGVIEYCFDALGQLKGQRNATMRGSATLGCPDVNDSGIVATSVTGWTTAAYDKLGRMTQRIEPEFQSDWTYDKYADQSTCNKGIGKLCESSTLHGVDKKIVYDNYGREVSDRSDIFGGPSFATGLSYDATTGRLATKTYPTGLQVAYGYTSRGFLEVLKLKTALTVSPLPNAQGSIASGVSLPLDTVLWRASAIDARGGIEQEVLANGVVDKTSFDAATGRIAGVTAGAGGSAAVLSHQYGWDGINNLTSRIDNNGDGVAGAVNETFGYDSLNRLSQYTVSAPAIPNLSRAVALQYNALGMLLYKTDAGNYSYGASGPGAVRPHTLQTLAGNGSTSYSVDANGNITGASGGKYTTLTYTSFDNILTVSGANGTAQYAWQYNEDHARIKETRVVGGNTRTVWYLHPDNVGGLGFESEVDTNPASQSNRHFLTVGGKSIGVLISSGALPTLAVGQMAPVILSSMGASKLEYWHKDHLGSIAATTDHLGNVTQRYAYDPFGKRRYTNGSYDEFGNVVVDWSPSVNYGTARGFTGHEELDDIGLVNMNGRLYDATAGLFVQADPHVTNPTNLQNYNRYGYVLNNPLNATDPSGFDGGDTDLRFNGNGTGLLAKLLEQAAQALSAALGLGSSNSSDGNSAPASPPPSYKPKDAGRERDPTRFCWCSIYYPNGLPPDKDPGPSPGDGSADLLRSLRATAEQLRALQEKRDADPLTRFVDAMLDAQGKGSTRVDDLADQMVLIAKVAEGGELTTRDKVVLAVAIAGIVRSSKAAKGALPELRVSASKYPQLAENITNAQKAGHPDVLTHGGNAAANRAGALDSVPNIKGLSRDEYPFASSMQGGQGSWVGHVPPSQQSAQGALIKNFLQQNGVQAGDQYRVIVVP